ncbi:MAG: rhamnulokinase [Clostridia bacterium]|nr:rhamnulokinase [Clostridia bacterium]
MAERVLAIDFGASSGRAIIGEFDGEKITTKEIHRFSNDPVRVGGTLYWDFLRLFHEVKQSISKAALEGKIDSIGIDTWGVDFGLIDKYGCLIENPVHYRDTRTKGLIQECSSAVPDSEFYARTGIQFLEFNTVYQLYSLKKYRPHLLERADKILFMPDLFGYFLTGNKTAEYSIATTSQMVDAHKRIWASDLVERLGISPSLLCDISPSGSVLGMLSDDICTELGVESVPVISVCGHDTQSALTAVPSTKKDFAFMSCGTWSLAGTELENPLINDETFEMNITNEGGYDSSVGFLKNIIGLWLIQESRRHWNRHGGDYSYADLEKEALASKPFACFIDPDCPDFIAPGNIPQRIRDFCARTGQHVPESVGEIMRCIYESLALKYKDTYAKLEICTGKTYPEIHIIGGGTKDTLLCRMTACSTGKRIIAGPVEATVLGNIAVQLMSKGAIADVTSAREIIGRSEKTSEYLPEDTAAWDEAYEKYKTVIS